MSNFRTEVKSDEIGLDQLTHWARKLVAETSDDAQFSHASILVTNWGATILKAYYNLDGKSDFVQMPL